MKKASRSPVSSGSAPRDSNPDESSRSCDAACPGASSTPSAVSRRRVLQLLGATSGLLLVDLSRGVARSSGYQPTKHRWGYAIDIERCIGCCACMRACRAENDVPAGHFRTWIERYRIDRAGHVSVDVPTGEDYQFQPIVGEVAQAFFVPKICNQCDVSPCTQVCPVSASYQTEDGVVLVDDKLCVGCGYCVQACPYGTRFLHPATHTADKCTLCYHRITRGQLPACVLCCPTEARVFGDLADPKSEISRLLRNHNSRFLKPELGTKPQCHYLHLDREVV